ncbi:MAG: sigma-70 family RNA polymerase sigma factor [Anaerolineae bacterium]|nr:sigma-70 family RNA polymerase sigma factor [Anaerolineae bacterium]
MTRNRPRQDANDDAWPRFQPIYDAFLPRIYGYVAARIDDKGDVEDVVSEVFVKALTHFEGLRSQQDDVVAAWIFKIARNAVHDHYRRRRMTPVDIDVLDEQPSDAYSPDGLINQRDEAAVLRRMVRELPPRRREVILLKFFGELRNREIARVLGLDERTVAAHLSRALKDLAARFRSLNTPVEARHDDE